MGHIKIEENIKLVKEIHKAGEKLADSEKKILQILQ
jgi:hypothetical protein